MKTYIRTHFKRTNRFSKAKNYRRGDYAYGYTMYIEKYGEVKHSEICGNCKTPFGMHYGDSGNCPNMNHPMNK